MTAADLLMPYLVRLGQWGQKALQSMAPILNKVPYKKNSYFPKNTKYLLGFNEPNLQCATHCSV